MKLVFSQKRGYAIDHTTGRRFKTSCKSAFYKNYPTKKVRDIIQRPKDKKLIHSVRNLLNIKIGLSNLMDDIACCTDKNVFVHNFKIIQR